MCPYSTRSFGGPRPVVVVPWTVTVSVTVFVSPHPEVMAAKAITATSGKRNFRPGLAAMPLLRSETAPLYAANLRGSSRGRSAFQGPTRERGRPPFAGGAVRRGGRGAGRDRHRTACRSGGPGRGLGDRMDLRRG